MTGDGAPGSVADESGLIITVNHGPFWDAKWNWLCYAILGVFAWAWESRALGGIAGVLTVLSLLTVWSWHGEMRMVERALASGHWQPGRLSQGEYDDDPCWDVTEGDARPPDTEVATSLVASPQRTWKTSTMQVPLPAQQPIPVRFCNVDDEVLIIRFGQQVVLSRVKSAPVRGS